MILTYLSSSTRIKTNSPLNTLEIEKVEKYFNVKLMLRLTGEKDKTPKIFKFTHSTEVEKHNKKFDEFNKKNYPAMPDPNNGISSTDDDSICIPYYSDLVASCGPGGFVLEDNPQADFFPISTKYGLNKHTKYFIISAFGNSMEKTIHDKELVIFEDWKNKQIIDDKIYFFCLNNRFFIKRLAFNFDEIIITADNKAEYEVKSVPVKELDENNLIIYGKFKGKIEND